MMNTFRNIFLFFLSLSFTVNSFGQNFDLTTEDGNTYNSGSYTCGTSTISDVFADGDDVWMTICPAAGEVAYFDITSITLGNPGGTNSDDIIYVYDGTGTGGTLLYQDGPASNGSAAVIVGNSPGACITIHFQCNNSTGPSFTGGIGCLPAAAAGADQAPGDCSTSATLAGNSVAPATGTWTVSPAGPTITSPNSATSGVTGIEPTTTYTFTWTSDDGTASYSDDMTFLSEGVGCWDYCVSTWSDPDDEYISNVSFNTLNVAIGVGSYSDETGTCTVVAPGATHELCIDITMTSAWTNHVWAFFDWDNDGVFETSIDLGTQVNTGQVCINVTVPAGATPGNTVMRIIIKETTDPTSCITGSFGDAADFCVTVDGDHCINGVQDADETGVDCGGADCAACPTCSDGIQNQDETGIDCGGVCAVCTGCAIPVCVTYTSGDTWVAPTGVTSATIQVWGGGGAGGGVNATAAVSGGGGGAGGSFAGSTETVVPGNSYTIVVGAGGTGADGAAGGSGGTSSFGGSTVVAVGGAGGAAGLDGYGAGATGSTTGNTGTSFAGGNGVTETASNGGGGGGGAGTTAVGGNATDGTGGTGGATGGGAGGDGASSTTAPEDGADGTVPGGAGGGAYTQFVASASGGDGGAGQVIVCYTPPACSGTPDAGVTSASASTFSCSGAPVTLSNTAYLITCGLTGQWQSSPDGATWTDIAGETGPTYVGTATVTTYYQYIVTCTSSTLSATSNTVQVTVTSATSCCDDGILNYGETWVDCGGSCAACPTVPPATTATTGACPAGATNSVTLMTCADVGTDMLETSSGVVTYTDGVTSGVSPAPTCGGGTYDGSWSHYELAPDVTTLTFNWESDLGGSTDLTGNNPIMMQVYQGPSCAALTAFECLEIGNFSAGSFFVNSTVVQNLNDAEDVWIFMFHTGAASKVFSLPYDIVGSVTPDNDICSDAIASSEACNLGASVTDVWTAPEVLSPGVCDGGVWTSNENTVWYTFTADATTASLSVENITCNNGESGLAQMAAFTSCACSTTPAYTSDPCFKGCAVGTGTITLTSLTIGQTIYMAMDGSAGDVCKMDFVLTDLTPLPITLTSFSGYQNNNVVNLNWVTESEINNAYFSIERSIDGKNFDEIGRVSGVGTSNYMNSYQTIDKDPHDGIAYYRLKQVDFDGEYAYTKIISVAFTRIGNIRVYPNPSTGIFTLDFDENVRGEYEVNVYDLKGNRVTTKFVVIEKNSDENHLIDLTNFDKGIYFMNVSNGKESINLKVITK